MAIGAEDFFDDEIFQEFPELANMLSQTAEGMFPAEGLSEEERREMARLMSRQNRLQPLEKSKGIGSTRISGNPFSFDISPVVNAVQSGLEDTINAVRQKRLMGDEGEAQELEEQAEQTRSEITDEPGDQYGVRGNERKRRKAEELEQQAGEARGVMGRLQELQQKQETAASQQEAQNEMIQKMFPDLAGRLVEMEKQLATGQQEQENMLERIRERTGADIKLINERGRQELQQLDKELENWMEQQKFKLENDMVDTGGGRGGGGVSSGDINNFRQITKEMTGVIDSEVAKKKIDLQTARSRAQSDRLPEDQRQQAREEANQLSGEIEELESQKQNLLNTTFQRAAEQLGMPVEQVRELFLGDQEEGGGNENPGEEGGGDPAASDSTQSGPSYNDIIGNNN